MNDSVEHLPSAPPAGAGRWWVALPRMFSRRWWIATLLVLAAMAGMVRLAFWQLGRLDQRRAANAEIARELALPPLLLGVDPLPTDPTHIRYRRGTATGELDLTRQVALKIQNFQGSAGIHLVAPLVLDGGRAVLVDRGWIPDDLADSRQWSQFDEPGRVTVTGFLRVSDTVRRQAAGTEPADALPQLEWYRVDIGAIQAQVPYDLLPVYIVQSPGPKGNVALPYRADPEFDLSEGAHLGWALQWVAFAVILFAMYADYVRKRSRDQE